jgi:competence protein ComEA
VDPQGGQDVVVDVAGAVGKAGVYRLPGGSRVNDAVQRAGGATARAELESINLAARLTDGQQVVVPRKLATGAGGGGATAGSAASVDDSGPISLGTATVEQLDTIDGIGPVTAQDIIDFRDQHGGISSIDQLDQISGIGPATMESLRARLQP